MSPIFGALRDGFLDCFSGKAETFQEAPHFFGGCFLFIAIGLGLAAILEIGVILWVVVMYSPASVPQPPVLWLGLLLPVFTAAIALFCYRLSCNIFAVAKGVKK